MRRVRPLLLLGVVLVAVLVAMVGSLALQRSAERTFAAQRTVAEDLLVAVLDLETGLRGYNIAVEDAFLAPYRQGRREYALAYARAIERLPRDARARELLRRQDGLIQRWIVEADARILALQRGASRRPNAGTLRRKALIDDFRAANGDLRARVSRLGDARRTRASAFSLALVGGVVGLLALLGWFVVVRDLRRRERAGASELADRREQRDLLDAVQVVADEHEAHLLVQRHLTRVVPGAEVTVLQRNNSDNRLVPATPLPAGSALAAPLDSATPRDCLAVRQGREHRRGDEVEPLLVCPVCGELPGTSACQPFLVGGEVIGSVLLRRDRALEAGEADRIADAVALAGPTLANLRTLAIAETQAGTDALTGLANRRQAAAVLARLASSAERQGTTLAAIGVDLDHFKRINDTHGHDSGDAVLSAVGHTLRRQVRGDDLVARMGGEEFLVVVEGADLPRAREIAETLRRAVAETRVPGLDVPLSASVGVGVLPVHAPTLEALLRQTDRALYRAKELGRNRVEVAVAPGAGGAGAEDRRVAAGRDGASARPTADDA